MLLAHAGGEHTFLFTTAPVIVLLAAAALYGYGFSRLPARARRAWSGRGAAFSGALLVAGVALASPLEAAAEKALSVHMVQHVLLVLLAPPLLVASRPVTMSAIALPGRWVQALRSLRTARSGGLRASLHPLPALLLAAGMLWAWHLPALYEAAIDRPVLHVVEHAGFLAAGAAVWSVALGNRRSPGAALVVLLGTSLAGAALGALLAFAPQSLYPIYRQSYLGLTPLEHQQLAGLIMWLPGFAVYGLAAAWIAFRWFRELDRAHGAPPGALTPGGSGT